MSHAAQDAQPPQSREQQAIGLMQAGALSQAEAIFRDVLNDRPDDHQIMNVLAVLAAQQGRASESIPMFERALQHAPGDGGPADNTASIIQNMAASAYALVQGKDWANALVAYRKLLEFDPENASAPNAIIHCVMATGEKPRLADFAPGVEESELGSHVFIACMPKSGSTFLKLTMCALTGWPDSILTYAFLQNEEELYLPFMRSVVRDDTVTQQHLRATVPNLQMMRAFQIRPVVLVRNLFDVVVSYTDFFDNGAKVNTFFGGRWDGLARERKLDLVIDNFMPWYNAFYASWSDVIKYGLHDCKLVRYEDMIADKQGTLESLAEFYALDKSAQDCAAAIEATDGQKVASRFNKGKAGRGDELSGAQKDRIRYLAGYFPDVDFEPVGL